MALNRSSPNPNKVMRTGMSLDLNPNEHLMRSTN
eukprot:CAMPEP_0183304712 /NCGR_PEP_ID=MMETSP0160_2-20130417/9712_1 /TAXON_ID=2839 ORGANISM="Odontella Sinensis, Strain Grunow 1884" /NCGR_SAMPLE_ID=MMETSP0160_2 /ASSEMBLY_ACC=CAM_ASM_000250 /LENGTH=33 /DNA_ID= /DNA_START= /DNA_END= /DNA_ORIENTATION=